MVQCDPMIDPAMLLSVHQDWDIALWLVFFAGQCVYILKRCAMAIRSKTNPIKSRRAFLVANWDILAYRSVIEFALLFYPLRHLTVGTIAGIIHFSLPVWIPAESQVSAIGFFFIGIGADVMLDWIGESDKTPSFIKKFLQEQVPDVALPSPPPTPAN